MSKVVSYLFHPIFMPLFGIVIILNSGTYISILDESIIRALYLIVGTFTVIVPLGLLPIFYFTSIIKNIELSDKRQRLLPYLFTFISFYIANILVKKLPVSSFISAYLFASCMTVLVILIISGFWKISTHMTGIGGLIGLILSLSYLLKTDLMYYLMAAILLSGFIAASRIKLKEHNLAQIYVGFFVGILVVSTICVFYS